MYEIIIDAGWSSQSVYDDFKSYKDAKKALDELVNSGTYERARLCIVTKWQGWNSI